MKWTLQGFLSGQDFASRYARLSLPVLVSRAEQYRGVREGDIPEFTYGGLASIVASPNYAHPMHYALGSIGYALEELNAKPEWRGRKIPPIQLMVWSAGRGSPGDDAFSFIGISKEQVARMPVQARQATARSVRGMVLAYPYWRQVLAALKLEPLTLNLPSAEAVASAPEKDGHGAGESIHHKRLKSYLANHWALLGLDCAFQASFEICLPSGDRIDLMLEDPKRRRRVCVEVKSRISGSEDLIRGIFQCVKYEAILDAQERYELQRNNQYVQRQFQVLLVTETPLPPEIETLSEFFRIRVFTVTVPDDYQIP